MTDFTSWGYRVVRFPFKDDPAAFYLSLCEVYYDSNGNVSAWCEATATSFDTMDDLAGALTLMLAAASDGRITLDGTLLPGYEAWRNDE